MLRPLYHTFVRLCQTNCHGHMLTIIQLQQLEVEISINMRNLGTIIQHLDDAQKYVASIRFTTE